MVDVRRRRLLEVLGVLSSATALLSALPEVVHAYSINNTIVDPRSVSNSLIAPSICDVIVQPGQSPTGQSQPMVVASDGTVIVDSSGTVVSSLGCNETYTNYVRGSAAANSSYATWQCPGSQTITSGIQEAINYIVNTKGGAGGVVCIAPGTYYVDSIYDTAIGNDIALMLDGFSNITIRGSGMDRTVIQFQEAKGFPYVFSAYNASNIVIRDLTMLTYDVNNNPGLGIFLMNTNGLVVEGVHYRGNALVGTGTAPDGSQFPYAYCPSTGCSGGLASTFTPVSSNLVFRNNIVELGHGLLSLRYTKNVLVEGNLFRLSVGDHIIVAPGYTTECPPSYNVFIRGNTFLYAGDTVIDLSPQSCSGAPSGYAPGSIINGAIEDNYIETAGNAILAFGTANLVIRNNTIRQYGMHNGIASGYSVGTPPIIIGNRLYNSPGIAGYYVIDNYCEDCGGISTYPDSTNEWYIVGNILKNTPFGIRCGGLYEVSGCTGVVANNKIYMYGQAGPMGGGIFDFRGPIYNTLIVDNYIEGPPLTSTNLNSGTYMPYGINLTNNSTSQGNVITGNTIVNAKCAYPLQNKVNIIYCGGFTSACGTSWFPIQVASPNNVIYNNVIYAVNGDYNYGNLEPIPPGILKLSLTSGTAVQNPYPFDLELEIPVSITSTPASVQVYIGQSQSSLSLILQRNYSYTGTDTISIRLPVGWWIQVNTINASIGTPTVIGL